MKPELGLIRCRPCTYRTLILPRIPAAGPMGRRAALALNSAHLNRAATLTA